MVQGGNTSIDLSQKDIWDDSALVQSWDAALQEYKKYHSVAATGGNMDEEIRKLEAKERGEILEVPVDSTSKKEVRQDVQEDSEMVDPVVAAGKPATNEDTNIHRSAFKKEPETDIEVTDTTQQAVTDTATSLPTHTMVGTETQGPILPIGQVDDPELKNLLMSWYWAGYYTGLHEGQKRAKAPGGQ